MTEQRRVHERYECVLPVTLRLGDREIQGETRNLSLGGMLIVFAEQVPYGTEGKLRVRLPALKEDSDIPVTIRWATDDALGVQFGSLRALEVWAFNQMFKSK